MKNNSKFETNYNALKLSNINLANIIKNVSDKSDSCYSAPVIAKNNELVPLLKDGKALFSIYNPAKDADNFLKDINFDENQFIAVSSLANAQHLTKALNFANIHILIIEKNAESIADLFNYFDFVRFLNNKNFSLCTLNDLEETFKNSYIPQLHGKFLHLALRPWAQYNAETEEKIQIILKNCLEHISADYSVQAHFAKIWQRNILRNIKTLSQINQENFVFPTEKKAAIIGAGPSLDESIDFLKINRKNYFIIATDTAWRILLQYNISADAVVTIDGQNISYRHFMDKFPNKETCFVIDLCAHPTVAEKALKNGNRIQFVASNHPLCTFIRQYAAQKNFYFPPEIDTTSGTVTIAALDFAVKCGFTEIELFGADFAYTKSKPYAKGSYLDSTFENASTLLSSKETLFNALMFRTPVIRKNNTTVTTAVLNRYAKSLDEYLAKCKTKINIHKYVNKNMTHIFANIHATENFIPIFLSKTLYKSFDYADFKVWLLNLLKSYDPAITAAILPLAAWCERMKLYKSSSGSILFVFEYAHKMASKQTM